MSATPWRVQIGEAILAERERLRVNRIELDRADVMLVLAPWLNAFAALLAVAKAVDKAGNEVESPLDWSDVGYIWEAMKTLDAAHPGWREWTP